MKDRQSHGAGPSEHHGGGGELSDCVLLRHLIKLLSQRVAARLIHLSKERKEEVIAVEAPARTKDADLAS